MLRTRKALPEAIFVFMVFGRVLLAEQLPIRLYTHADGLSHIAVRRIKRDSRGFLWLCAGDRLNRFDGYRFATYAVGSGPSDIVEGASGIYWVATYGGGVYRLDFAAASTDGNPKITPYALGPDPNAKLVNVIYRDHRNRIWAGTDNGLYLLESEDNGRTAGFHPVELGIVSPPASLTEVGALTEDREGGLWIGTSHGPVRRLPDGRMIHYVPAAAEEIKFVRALAVDRAGNVWIGHTRGFTIFAPEPQASLTATGRFKRTTMSIVHRAVATEGTIALPDKPGTCASYSTRLGRTFHSIWDIYELSDGPIMIGTWGDGLWIFDSGRLRHYTTAHGLSEDSLFSFSEDAGGNRWLGTKSSGLMKLVRSGFTGYDQADGIPKTKMLSMFHTQSGQMCVIGRQWLIATFDGRRFQTTQLQLTPVSERSPSAGAYVHPIIQDHSGEWWIGSGRGVYHFPSVREIPLLAHIRPIAVYGTNEGLSSDLAYAVYEDARGDIWIGSGVSKVGRGGLARWQRTTGRLRVFSESDGLPRTAAPTAFADDNSGNLWMGLWDGGLIRYRDGRFEVLGDLGDSRHGGVQALYRDSSGRMWVGTYYGGAGRIDHADAPHPQIRHYTVSDGLSSNDVGSFAEDQFGRLYLANADGVTQLDPATGRMERYPGPAGSGLIRLVLADRNGGVWAAGTAGIWRFLPRTGRESLAPRILMSSVHLVGGRTSVVELGGASIPEMRLPFGQNQMRIEFFSPNFDNPLRYQYKVGETGAEWSPPSEQRAVELANLAPGHYTFAVRAVRDSGAVSAVPATFSFTIEAPFWRQWWFLTLSAGFIILVIYRLHRYRIGRLLELERVRLRIATDLHDDIGSTLSQISVLSEVVRQHLESDNGVSERLSTITILSRDLVDSLSDIVWAINPKRDHLSDLSYRMRRFAGELLSARSIDFYFTAPSTADDLKMGADLRREIFLIFKEAVNNAARHSGCTRIDAAFEVKDGWLELRVEDNGRGFEDLNENQGNGIASMHQRAARVGGTLDVQSRRCGGTAVRLRAPVARRRLPFGLR